MAANAAHEDDENDFLNLSPLSTSYSLPHSPPPLPLPLPPLHVFLSQPPPQPALQLSPTHPILISPLVSQPPPSQPSTSRPRRHPPIPPPFPWATDQRATVHRFEHLFQNQISSISGLVQCKWCHQNYEMEFDLHEKLLQVKNYIFENKSSMHNRAPSVWMNPVLPSCRFCQRENIVKPVMAKKNKNINWLFLLLGQMLGCCKVVQLRYFCKHTGNHQTGGKDQVLYLTYMTLCKQVDPNGSYDPRE